ncbi:hypothetical protein RUE5091_00295 [Ruegeria denitrificans]|uniref:DUF6455 domain-containing protein n=1 Tax=Ruegeria denitrificans TaxID=1715692 RepID=A0A0P1I1U5_9RHOB|nr:DUF6455 family protein [Ruegeria denitrificans]CUJ85076.1 hypothetical protein RUE5091_00295 [Ruegeria denitrificans]
MARNVLGDVEKHFWLTRSVARCMNISFTEAMAKGHLTPERYAELVTRCRVSQCSDQCGSWLSEQQSEAQRAPEFCANADLLNAMKT